MKTILNILLVLISINLSVQEKDITIDEISEIRNKLNSINVSEIKSACDCCDAMEKVADILVKSTEIFPTKEDAENDVFGKVIIELTGKKTFEVASRCSELKLNDNDIKSCTSFKSLEEKSKILKEKSKK